MITILVDFCILPLTLFATALFRVIDFRKRDLANYDPKRKTIIFLHGSGNNESEWAVARLMILNKYNVFSFNYAGLFSNRNEDGPGFYAQSTVRQEINSISKQTGCTEFILIGHSMGGLIATDYAKNVAPDDKICVSQIVTIGTPWYGAPLAGLKGGRRYVDMGHDSEYLHELRICTNKINIYSVASRYDWAVPYERGLLNKNNNCKLYKWYGHYTIIISPLVWLDVLSSILKH